jgi:hypothetical protein
MSIPIPVRVVYPHQSRSFPVTYLHWLEAEEAGQCSRITFLRIKFGAKLAATDRRFEGPIRLMLHKKTPAGSGGYRKGILFFLSLESATDDGK